MPRWGPGSCLGHFEIIETLGVGGMGVVYKARDTRLGRPVALKVLAAGLFRDETARRRFLREAQLAASIVHPNVATVHEIDEQEGAPFIAMEWVPGEDLKAILARGPLRAGRAIEIASQVCDALEAAHRLGIVHRDVKSSNIRITPEGKAKVLDFGLAKALAPSGAGLGAEAAPRRDRSEGPPSRDELPPSTVSPLTRLGVAVGTVSYMSPEQASGGPVDARSDIFSLAVVIYEALAGELPFRGQSDREVLEAIRARDPEPLGEACPGLPPELAGIVARCLSKNPDERFPSATALREKLFDVAHAASRQPVSSWLRRGVVVGAIGLVALGVAMLFTPGRRSPPLAERPWTLIGDFENHTGDRLLELTFRELLTAALEQSQYLKVFPRSRTTETLQRMRRGAAEPLDRPTAREICRRENLNALIAGEMLTVPAGYRVVLRTIEPETDEVKDVLTDTFADKAAIWESVTRLAAKLRISLGEGSSEVSRHTRPLDEVTTRSFEALQSFSRASDLQREGRMDEARLLMASAVALDPEFAIAHARLATLWDAMGEEGEALRAAGRAYSLRERVSAHERYHIEGSYHSLRGEYERAAEAYGRLAALRPEDDAAQRFLAQSRGALGRLEEAVLSARRAAELRPSSIINQGYLAVLLAEANRNDEALGLVQRLASLSREGVYLRWAEGLAWLGKGSPEQAATAFHALAQEGGVYQDWGRLYLAQTSFYRGEWERARELLESDLRRDPSRMDRNAVTRAYWLARSESLRGRRSSALRVIESLEGARGPLARLEALNRAGVVYARLGVRDRAEAIAARLVALRDEFPSSLSRGLASHLNGELLLARGDLELALSELDRAREWLASVPVLEALARCHFARGDFERALSAYQEIEERRGTVLRWEFAFDLPLAQLGAARCLKALGRIEEASSRYEELLRQWSGASDLPSLREAERERDALRTDSNEL